MPSVAELVSKVRSRSDMVGTTFVTDSEIVGFLNEGITDIHDLLISTLGEQYYTISQEMTVPAGSRQATWYQGASGQTYYYGYSYYGYSYYELGGYYYNIPWRIWGISFLTTSGSDEIELPLERFETGNNRVIRTQKDWDTTPPRYNWRQWGIEFDTATDKDQIIIVNYTPRPPVLSLTPGANITDSLPTYLDNYDDYIVIYAAICCLNKQESDTTVLQNMLSNKKHMLEQNTGPKDMGRALTLGNMRRERSLDDW